MADLLLEAVTNNADIQATREEVSGLRAESDYAGSLPNPMLGVGLLNLPVDSFALDQEPMTQKQVSITQRFPWPGKRGLASEAQLRSAQKAEAKLKEQVLSLQREVVEAYYDLWFVAESLRLNGELSELVRQATHASESRYSAGRGVQEAVLAGELQLSRLTDEKLALKSRYRVLETRINGLLQRERYRAVTPESQPALPGLRPSGEWLARALGENPRLESLGRSVALSRASLSLAEKAAMPDVDIKVAYGQREDDQMGRSRDDFISLSASFPVPLWKGRREDRLIASKKAGERAALLTLQGYQRQLPHRIDELVSDMSTAVERHLFYKEDLVPRTRQLSGASVSRYEVGGATYNSMIDGAMATMKAELAARKFLRDALVAEAKLKELTGEMAPAVGALVNDRGAALKDVGEGS
ncbi:copper transporter [Desulfoluna limicola]|uniref:Copper transporter n=1 Tax=Desulfoluna limicola TaxID=2810562 RepID=A0ABN6F789_9BACT|nr:TolC family protein [Desulfoluna limicola]BCS97901.1 copper transporter [Desulfoluna limicola]